MRASIPFRTAIVVLLVAVPAFCSQKPSAAAALVRLPHSDGPATSKSAATQRPRQKGAAEQAEAPFVIQRYVSRVVFHNDGTSRSDLDVEVAIRTKAGVQRFSHLAFPYNAPSQKLVVISVRVRKPGSAAFTSASAEWNKAALAPPFASAYANYLEKVVTVPGLRAGDTLAYHVALITSVPSTPGQFWYQYNSQKGANVRDEQVEISLPRNRHVTIKTWPGMSPTVTETGTVRTYRWIIDHRAPGANTKEPEAKRLEPPPKTPAIQLTTFRSWDQVGRWYAALERGQVAPNPTIRARARELTHGLSTEREKAESLYDFVATQIRSVNLSLGLGGYKPHRPVEVLTSKFGNSNDKHTLLEALLATAGIRAYPALIPSTGKIDPAVPSPAHFDHKILVVPTGADPKNWVWLDTTPEVAPFGMLAAPLRGKQVLVIPTADTRARVPAPARLVETPADPPFAQFQQIRVTGRIDRFGTLTAHVHYSMTGDNALTLRMAFHETPRSSWRQLGQLLSLNDGFRGNVTNVETSDPAQTRKPFEIDYEIKQTRFLDWARKNAELALPLPAIGMPEASAAPGTGDGSIPLGSPLQVDTRARIELPSGSGFRLPVPVNIAREYAAYRSRYAAQGNVITAERHIAFIQREIAREQLSDYIAFAHAVQMDEAQGVAVTPPAKSPASKN